MKKKYPDHKNIDISKVDEEILKFWKKNKVFEQSIDSREDHATFIFYEGPPSANGTPGIHHVMARTVKDIFCRYKTMKGFKVIRKGGWDAHGLPVELQVEKELGISKEDIGKKISVEEYNEKCRQTVMRYKTEWDELTEKIGYWVDLKNPYITFENTYIESCWYLLKKLYEKGLLYKGYTIQPYSPAAGTGLSSHELNQPGCYRNVKDTSVVAQFKLTQHSKHTLENLVRTLQSNTDFSFGEGWEDVYILAWTTTPWTLPSNSALAVGEKISYALIKTFNPYTHQPICVVLAKELIGKYFNEKSKDADFSAYDSSGKNIPWSVVAEFKGTSLVGLEYEQLLPYVRPQLPAFRIIPGDFVSTEDGTGIVHIAPTFGADDFRVAQQSGIPPITVKDETGKDVPLVDKRGRFVAQMHDDTYGFAGEYVKEDYLSQEEKHTELLKQQQRLQHIIAKLDKYLNVDERIALKLKLENKAFRVEKYEHSYPHCWRTDKPVLYYPLDSWFIKTTAVKDKLVELNKTINWKPESTGTGRFGNWLENLVDWNLSRSRYWGTPLPVWRTEDGTEEKCIGSMDELRKEMAKAVKSVASLGLNDAQKEALLKINTSGIKDLHRPYVDDVILVSDSGKPMFREPDLVDVWFDSGAMPYAQHHWPFESEKKLDEIFPADFISEGVDQTRGWFFTLHAIAGMLFDSVAFKNVLSTGLVLDKNGEKMSKRKGNVIDPFTTVEKYGADATRWYMIGNAPPWDNLKFNLDGVEEVQRKFFSTLQNTYSFFALYANLDGFAYKEKNIPLERRSESDRWIISKVNNLIKTVDQAYHNYEPTKAVRAIEDFVCDDLSNWYVRLNRKRFWKNEYNEDKIAAYQTLYACLNIVAKLAAPVAPFYTEKIYQDLNHVTRREKPISIHLTNFPDVYEKAIDEELETRMNYAQQISSLVHSLRKAHNLRVRLPLSKILIPVLNEKSKQQIDSVKELILSEVNVKKIEYIDDTSGVLVKKIKPNFRKLGKEHGSRLKEISTAISSFSQDDIARIEREHTYSLILNDGYSLTLTPEDVEITSHDIPGWAVASANGITVALDVNVTDELKKEGIARDLVNRIQNLRKEMGLDVLDKIKISVLRKNELVDDALLSNKEYICTETQATNLSLLDSLPDGIPVDMDEFELMLKIEQ
ncbi:MAG: isoleucine--tRNA ligase [Cytophagaceae bacterium]|nr:isoleucine--tRNA ligase [Cytophagaceae bacterium]MDW8456107.1 isoleucine--tRNA ligase [Cytophagaceae bacterium]